MRLLSRFTASFIRLPKQQNMKLVSNKVKAMTTKMNMIEKDQTNRS